MSYIWGSVMVKIVLGLFLTNAVCCSNSWSNGFSEFSSVLKTCREYVAISLAQCGDDVCYYGATVSVFGELLGLCHCSRSIELIIQVNNYLVCHTYTLCSRCVTC